MTLTAAILDPYAREWLDLLLRLLHVIAAIAWIGASFYFVLLDQSLRPPADEQDIEDGVRGELWEVHGGGFYHVKKYQVTPPEMPDHLAWFKWEAYTTWLSGFALMILLYWLDARAYMIDRNVADLTPWQAVGASVALIVAAWVFYDIACRVLRTRDERVLAAAVAIGVVLAAWVSAELFSARAAWLQTGAMIGSVMAANVFFNIIPAHWELIRAREQLRDPDPAPGIEAKRRSVHNNYLTLPVLLTMLAGHFSFVTGHEHSWLILLALMVLTVLVRHFFNVRHSGSGTPWWLLVVAAAGVLALAVWLRPDDAGTGPAMNAASQRDGKLLFTSAGCPSCHTLADSNATGTSGPNLDDARPDTALVRDRVANGRGGMPAFKDRLDKQQIDEVAAYVARAS